MEQKEEMKAILGYEGLYSVTESGKIYSHVSHRFMKTSTDWSENEQVALRKDGKSSCLKVAKIVAQAYLTNPDPEYLTSVAWKDGNKSNNHANNLKFIPGANSHKYIWKCKGKEYNSISDMLSDLGIEYEKIEIK